jgi:hypothetical protein
LPAERAVWLLVLALAVVARTRNWTKALLARSQNPLSMEMFSPASNGSVQSLR